MNGSMSLPLIPLLLDIFTIQAFHHALDAPVRMEIPA
jgi:hypothetical protein